MVCGVWEAIERGSRTRSAHAAAAWASAGGGGRTCDSRVPYAGGSGRGVRLLVRMGKQQPRAQAEVGWDRAFGWRGRVRRRIRFRQAELMPAKMTLSLTRRSSAFHGRQFRVGLVDSILGLRLLKTWNGQGIFPPYSPSGKLPQ